MIFYCIYLFLTMQHLGLTPWCSGLDGDSVVGIFRDTGRADSPTHEEDLAAMTPGDAVSGAAFNGFMTPGAPEGGSKSLTHLEMHTWSRSLDETSLPVLGGNRQNTSFFYLLLNSCVAFDKHAIISFILNKNIRLKGLPRAC